FYRGQLQELGGPDFKGSNPFALQMGVALAFTAAAFLRGKLAVRICLALVASMILNTIIMTRGRGAFLALIAGAITALVSVARTKRRIVVIALLLGVVSLVRLADVGYWQRIVTIKTVEDRSALSRFEVWKAGLTMLKDYPLGVGPGNFSVVIGNYDRRHVGRDAHNTFVRCACELGLPGLVMLVVILGKAYVRMWRVREFVSRNPRYEEVGLGALALLVAITIYLVGGLTSTMLYVEGMWWLMGLAISLGRIVDNLAAEKSGEIRTSKDRSISPGMGNSYNHLEAKEG
ncbi:hypothetical protein LCGC14_2577140, partial [marine sediment metagenome]